MPAGLKAEPMVAARRFCPGSCRVCRGRRYRSSGDLGPAVTPAVRWERMERNRRVDRSVLRRSVMEVVTDLVLITMAVGVLALVIFTGVVTWRMIRRVRKWRARLLLVMPQGMPEPGPEMVGAAGGPAHP